MGEGSPPDSPRWPNTSPPNWARALIAAGAPLDRRSDGQTRLWRAAFNQNPAAVDLLLELGAGVAPNDNESGEWPLHAICFHMDWDEDTEGAAAIERRRNSLLVAARLIR